MQDYQTFLSLHQQALPLLIGNAWDITSATAFERLGFKAVATSSVAVARSMGYEDKEQIPFELLLTIVKGISKHIQLPLSVDLEAGYSRTIPGIIENIDKLYDAGVVGFNIEDSVITEKGKMQDITAFQQILSSIRDHMEQTNRKMFVNARTDAYVHKLPEALPETLQRAAAYEKAGASGIFVPFLDEEAGIKQIVQATTLPVNLFPTPALPSFNDLADWGVKRISMGGAIYRTVINSLENTLQAIQTDQSFSYLYKK